MAAYRIALVEDNPVNRNSFMQKVSGVEALSPVFIAYNGHDALSQLAALHHDRLPQLVFMDLEMPGLNGIDAIRIGKALYSHLHFIVLTVFDDDDKIFEAIKAGAAGYLLKHEPAEAIRQAAIQVMEYGGAPMSPAIARKTLQLLSRSSASEAVSTQALPELLTEKEKDVLRHLISGWDAKRIATELDGNVLTIRKHIAHIYHKLHISSQAQAISLAHKNRWI